AASISCFRRTSGDSRRSRTTGAAASPTPAAVSSSSRPGAARRRRSRRARFSWSTGTATAVSTSWRSAKALASTSDAATSARPSAYVRAVASADFDGDGRDDLAVGYMSYELETWRSGVDVLLSRPGGVQERRVLFASEDKVGIFALAAGDVDGDRARDLVALS